MFLILGLVAIVTALGMLFSRNAVYAALFLILNFGTVAVFYLILNAPFIALAQVTVYAGAIMVLFLFVIMLLGAEQTGMIPTASWVQRLPLFLGALLIAETILIFYNQRNNLPVVASLSADFGTPTSVGEILFNQYLLPFEVTSILLLVAMIGAIVLSRQEA
jgi:NADH-quinone oxidoreductase subunit J